MTREKAFLPGDVVCCYIKRGFNEKPPKSLEGPGARYIEIYTDGKLLHRHRYQDTFNGRTYWAFYIVPDPESQESKVFRKDWTGDFVRKLGALPAGIHPLEIRAYLQKGDVRVRAGTAKIGYDNSKPTKINLKKLADLIDKNRGRDPTAELDAYVKAHGGWAAWKAHDEKVFAAQDAADAKKRAKNYYTVTLKNNCNRSMTLSRSRGGAVIVNGRSTATVDVRRGTSARLTERGRTVASLTERSDGKVVVVCR